MQSNEKWSHLDRYEKFSVFYNEECADMIQ